jgi:signal transduction histidine kinase
MLVSNILDAAREGPGQVDFDPRAVDVCQVVRNIVDLFQVARPDRCLRLEANVAQPIRANIDVGRTEQVLSNLLDNASKFSPRDTPIEVAVQRTAAETVRVSVRDHGPGVPLEQRERIFERFVQAPSAVHSEGLGIGLYVSRTIVEQHGGSLRAQFPADGGSRFIIELPCAVGESS